MFTVALIGPDGAGKTTVARRLEHALDVEVAYLYMGVSAESSNHLLPTTRLVQAVRLARGTLTVHGGPDVRPEVEARPATWQRRVRRSIRATLRLANRLAEEWHRQLLAWRHLRRGRIVIFDRHFFADYYAYDVTDDPSRRLSRKIHGLLLARLYPRPDLVVYLDAPAALLLERKGEGTLDSLERRRGEYLQLAEVTRHFAVVDASRPLDDVVDEVRDVIQAFRTRREVGAWRSPRGTLADT